MTSAGRHGETCCGRAGPTGSRWRRARAGRPACHALERATNSRRPVARIVIKAALELFEDSLVARSSPRDGVIRRTLVPRVDRVGRIRPAWIEARWSLRPLPQEETERVSRRWWGPTVCGSSARRTVGSTTGAPARRAAPPRDGRSKKHASLIVGCDGAHARARCSGMTLPGITYQTKACWAT